MAAAAGRGGGGGGGDGDRDMFAAGVDLAVLRWHVSSRVPVLASISPCLWFVSKLFYYCWWLKSGSPVEVGSLSHYLRRVLYIPDGAGVLPSTVWVLLAHVAIRVLNSLRAEGTIRVQVQSCIQTILYIEGVPAWELTYPLPRHFSKKMFLFSRWDTLVPWE